MDKKTKIVVYSSPDCMYCYTVKGFLEEKGFKYEEINIYEDSKAYERMVEFSEQKNVPVTVIGDEVIIGWDKEKFKIVLDI